MSQKGTHYKTVFQVRNKNLSQQLQLSGEQNVSNRYIAERHGCNFGSMLVAAERTVL
jgi:hypothetical protein